MVGILGAGRSIAGAIALAGLIFGSAAHASTVTFGFSGGGGNTGSTTASFTSGDIELDVTSTGGNINVRGGGLGVQGSPSSGRIGVGEALTFVFSPAVTLLSSIVWESEEGTDSIRIADGSGNTLTTFDVTDIGGSLITQDLSGLNLTGDTFVFEVTATTGTNGGVRINALTVAAVPLPAGGLLLFAGLGGFIWLRRRKQVA